MYHIAEIIENTGRPVTSLRFRFTHLGLISQLLTKTPMRFEFLIRKLENCCKY